MWRFLKKLEIELPYDPAIPLLGIHTEESRRERDTCTPMFIAALFMTPLLILCDGLEQEGGNSPCSVLLSLTPLGDSWLPFQPQSLLLLWWFSQEPVASGPGRTLCPQGNSDHPSLSPPADSKELQTWKIQTWEFAQVTVG